MGRSLSVRAAGILLGCALCAVSFNNCAPSFQMPGAESLNLSESMGAQCALGQRLEAKANARLTAREYGHSLEDLFAGFIDRASLEAAIAAMPRESLSLSHTKLDFDSTISRAVQFNEAEAYSRIAELVADAFASRLKNFPDREAMQDLLGGLCLVTESLPNQACLERTYAALVRRVYRRPARAEEVTRLLAIHRDPLNSDKYEGVSFVVQYLLQSPDFLYKVEGPFDGSEGIYSLNDFEIATRLAYGIWGGPPSSWLLDAAAAGDLQDDQRRAGIIEKLFADPKAQRAAEDFYDQWLRTAQIPRVSDAGLGTSGLDPENLRASAVRELRDYTRHITWDLRGSYRDLMTSNLIVPASAELAQVYGVPRSTTPVSGPAERRGLLTRAGILMVKADGRSGPILRGARLRSDLLCDELMAPPDSVFSNLGSFSALDSTRQQTEDITRAGTCMGCHSQINPLGFAFENFSGLGQHRALEVVEDQGQSRTHTVNTRATAYLNGVPTSFNDGRDLSDRIVNGGQGAACMAKRYYQFVAGAAKTSDAGCEFAEMSMAIAQGQGSIVEMMKSYYARPEIRYRRAGAL